MLENVKNLVNHDRGQTFRVIMEALENLGYKTFHKVIDGNYYVPQPRERTYIVGFDEELVPKDFSFGFPEPEKTTPAGRMPIENYELAGETDMPAGWKSESTADDARHRLRLRRPDLYRSQKNSY